MTVRDEWDYPTNLRIQHLEERSDRYRQAALELHAEIRAAVAWTEAGGDPITAEHMLLKTADKWLPLLEASASTATRGDHDS